MSSEVPVRAILAFASSLQALRRVCQAVTRGFLSRAWNSFASLLGSLQALNSLKPLLGTALSVAAKDQTDAQAWLTRPSLGLTTSPLAAFASSRLTSVQTFPVFGE